MSELSPADTTLARAVRHELSEIRSHWILFLVLGIAAVVLGTLMISVPLLTNLATMTFLSIILILSGITQFIGAFWIRRWSGFLIQLLVGILYFVLGILTLNRPLEVSTVLTLLIAATLFVGGIFRIVACVFMRFEGWIWPMLGGLLSVLLGVVIWRQWPISGLYMIGLVVGFEVIISGWTWVMLALGIRRLPKLETPPNSGTNPAGS